MINALAGRFTKKGLRELCRRFAGDSAIGHDLLQSVLERSPQDHSTAGEVIRQCKKKPQANNRAFFILCAEYLSTRNNPRDAVEILQSSRFYRESQPRDPLIFYILGEIFFNNKNFDKALIEFLKVDKIHKGFRQTEDYLKQLDEITDRRAAKDGKTVS